MMLALALDLRSVETAVVMEIKDERMAELLEVWPQENNECNKVTAPL